MASWMRALAILLLVTTTWTGCAQVAPRPVAPAAVAVVDDDHAEVEKVRHRHRGAGALIALGCLLIVGAVIVDVVILPFTAPSRRAFCCCRGVARSCW